MLMPILIVSALVICGACGQQPSAEYTPSDKDSATVTVVPKPGTMLDAENNEFGFSPLFSKPPSFANAIVQNIGGGNTMVFNNALRALLREAGKDVSVISHDWWSYIVAAGCGGKIFYDC